MAISLVKGGNVNLSKEAPNMKRALVGLGWDVRATSGAAFDLDASAFLLKVDGKVRSEADFIFYNQLKSACGSVVHQGDNRTGQGDGDDEKLIVELAKVPNDVEKIAVAVTIHEATQRQQAFGQVQKAFVRIVDADTNVEVARYDLTEDASTNTAMIFGELYRHNGEWKFRAVGQGYTNGLSGLCNGYGIQA
ncbi:MAG: TerD family protein [Candidatus Obscuribacterales bacterium]|nr:TerD family protein [Candidatus Obscuribacterales bacterium]